MLLSLGVGGVTDGIKASSYDHRPRSESYISYGRLGTHCDNVTYAVLCVQVCLTAWLFTTYVWPE